MNRGQIRYLDWIERHMLKNLPTSVFVFGDNSARFGTAGQAKEMRGEPNAVGIATKRRPTMEPLAFFSDHNRMDSFILQADLRIIETVLKIGVSVYAPKDGLGTGLSQLPTRAPKIYKELRDFFAKNSVDGVCPWPIKATS